MSFSNWIRKITGRAGKASRNKRGAGSHVNTRANKRAASKALRRCQEDYEDEVRANRLVELYLCTPDPKHAHLWGEIVSPKSQRLKEEFEARGYTVRDTLPTFWEDYHLDIPDELTEEEI